MNRFPIWKGNRIGRYDDRLILRSVIFFALVITALSAFVIRNTGKKKKAVMEHGQKIRRTVLEQRMTYGTPEKQERWQTST